MRYEAQTTQFFNQAATNILASIGKLLQDDTAFQAALQGQACLQPNVLQNAEAYLLAAPDTQREIRRVASQRLQTLLS